MRTTWSPHVTAWCGSPPPPATSSATAPSPKCRVFYVQAHDGLFNAVLRAPLHSGTAHITASMANIQAMLDIEMTTELRPSIATGVVDLRFGARQSDFYKSISTFLDGDPSFKPELQTSVFATGKSATTCSPWRATTSIRSTRRATAASVSPPTNSRLPAPRSTRSTAMSRPRRASRSRATTCTSGSSASGRMRCGATTTTKEFSSATQLYSATQMNLHGAKVNYEPGKLEIAGFYANDIQAFPARFDRTRWHERLLLPLTPAGRSGQRNGVR